MARLMEGREKDCCCYFARDRTKSTSLSLSASDTRGELGGIGTPPVTAVQLPLPPLCTFLTSTSFGEPFSTVPSVRVAEISFWPLYFSATSFQAGPTTFLSTEWQAKQPLFFARSNPSSAWAVPRAAMVAMAKPRVNIKNNKNSTTQNKRKGDQSSERRVRPQLPFPIMDCIASTI